MGEHNKFTSLYLKLSFYAKKTQIVYKQLNDRWIAWITITLEIISSQAKKKTES